MDLLDAGDAAGLREHLKQHPKLVLQHVEFEGGNYFHSPTLLEFIAENPIRHGTLPKNIVEIARVILDVGADQQCDAGTGGDGKDPRGMRRADRADRLAVRLRGRC